MTIWQYKRVEFMWLGEENFSDVDALNELGLQGWELISSIYSNGDVTTHFLKKPVQWVDVIVKNTDLE